MALARFTELLADTPVDAEQVQLAWTAVTEFQAVIKRTTELKAQATMAIHQATAPALASLPVDSERHRRIRAELREWRDELTKYVVTSCGSMDKDRVKLCLQDLRDREFIDENMVSKLLQSLRKLTEQQDQPREQLPAGPVQIRGQQATPAGPQDTWAAVQQLQSQGFIVHLPQIARETYMAELYQD